MLTSKQEKFSQCVADGMTQAEAYRNSYNAKNMKPSTVMESASRLMADCNVSARVRELKDKLAQKALWTREKSAMFYLSVLVEWLQHLKEELMDAAIYVARAQKELESGK